MERNCREKNHEVISNIQKRKWLIRISKEKAKIETVGEKEQDQNIHNIQAELIRQ